MYSTIKEKLSLLFTLFILISLICASTIFGQVVYDTEVFFQLNANYVELNYNESFDFDVKIKGLSSTDVIWSLDDDRYLTVNDKGIVKVKENISKDEFGEYVVTLTARSTVGNFYDTATIFLDNTPSGAPELMPIRVEIKLEQIDAINNYIWVGDRIDMKLKEIDLIDNFRWFDDRLEKKLREIDSMY